MSTNFDSLSHAIGSCASLIHQVLSRRNNCLIIWSFLMCSNPLTQIFVEIIRIYFLISLQLAVTLLTEFITIVAWVVVRCWQSVVVIIHEVVNLLKLNVVLLLLFLVLIQLLFIQEYHSVSTIERKSLLTIMVSTFWESNKYTTHFHSLK